MSGLSDLGLTCDFQGVSFEVIILTAKKQISIKRQEGGLIELIFIFRLRDGW